MKVAAPVFRNRISPVFDVSHICVLVTYRDGSEEDRDMIDLTGLKAADRVGALVAEEVDVLICGAITGLTRNLAEAAGITVRSGVAGDAERVLEAFRMEGLDQPCFRMPGCPRRRNRRGSRRGERRGR